MGEDKYCQLTQCQECYRKRPKNEMKRALFSLAYVCSARCEIDNTIRVKSHPDKYTMHWDEECKIRERWDD